MQRKTTRFPHYLRSTSPYTDLPIYPSELDNKCPYFHMYHHHHLSPKREGREESVVGWMGLSFAIPSISTVSRSPRRERQMDRRGGYSHRTPREGAHPASSPSTDRSIDRRNECGGVGEDGGDGKRNDREMQRYRNANAEEMQTLGKCNAGKIKSLKKKTR